MNASISPPFALLRSLLVAALVMLAASCVQNPQRPTQQLSPDEQRMRQQADVFNKTVIEGAVIGGLVAAGIAILATEDAGEAVKWGAAGAAVGAGAGAYIASKQQKYANEEQRLDSMIADVRADNRRVAQLNDSAKRVIASDLSKIRRIDSQLASGKINLVQARRDMQSVDDNQRYLKSTLANLKSRRNEWEKVATRIRSDGNRQEAAQMDKEIDKLELQIASLETELDTLVDRRRISRVG